MSDLILPPGASQSPQGNQFEPYDSEMIVIQELWERLGRELSAKHGDLDDADRRIEEEFQNIGFKVKVQWWTSKGHGFVPEITIEDRLSGEDFDHDRMVHEVTNDILGIEGGGGVIKSSGPQG